jgi:serine phosphatase RsbU (regulator of sigma subunit)/CRP-like cAMP-binding protein
MTDPTALARHNVLFENISDEEFGSIRAKLSVRRYRKDDVIFAEGTEGNDLHLLVEGRVRISRPDRAGDGQVLSVLHSSDFFGESDLINLRPRSATVTAMEDCTTCTIGRQDLEALLNRHHPVALRMMQVLSGRLRTSARAYLNDLARSRERHRRQIARLEQLIDASKVLNSALDLDHLLRAILQTALKVVDGDRGTVYLLDTRRQILWSRVSKVQGGTETIRIELPIGKGIAGHVAATGGTLNIRDAYEDPRFNPEIDQSSGFRTRSILCMPIRSRDGTTLGVFQLLNKRYGLFTEDDEQSLAALSVHAGIAIERAHLYEREKSFLRMREELRVASRIQEQLLPKVVPRIPGYELAGRMEPAHAVGGDYFDFVPVPGGRMAICVGDVSGKGLPAALLMANVQATIRSQAMACTSPAECIANANRLLHHSTADEKFVTMFYGVLDPTAHSFTCTNAGHDGPILLTARNAIVRLKAGGVALGILEDFGYEQETTTLQSGETIVMYSDGVPEARNESGEEFGEERLVEVVREHRSDPAKQVVDEIIKAARDHTGGAEQWDDITVVVVRRIT